MVPNNKNIDQQRRFFSTTKRQKKGNIRFAKPSDEDRNEFLTGSHFEITDTEVEKKRNGNAKGTKGTKGRISISWYWYLSCLAIIIPTTFLFSNSTINVITFPF